MFFLAYFSAYDYPEGIAHSIVLGAVIASPENTQNRRFYKSGGVCCFSLKWIFMYCFGNLNF